MTFWHEGSLALGLLLGCVVLAKALSAGWVQITLKKPLDVQMREPELKVRDLRRVDRFQRGNWK